MISCGEGGEKEHLTQGLVLGVNVLSLPTEKHQKPQPLKERLFLQVSRNPEKTAEQPCRPAAAVWAVVWYCSTAVLTIDFLKN